MEQNINTDSHGGSTLATYLAAVASILSFIINHITKEGFMFVIGLLLAASSFYTGYLTQKEKKLAIKKLESELPWIKTSNTKKRKWVLFIIIVLAIFIVGSFLVDFISNQMLPR